MNEQESPPKINRFSSRRHRLDHSFLNSRLKEAKTYYRIAGYFSSSLLEVAGEELESIEGPVRLVCNSDLDPADVQTAKSARMAVVLIKVLRDVLDYVD